MVGPEAFTEVRYLAFERMRQTLGVITETAADFWAQFGRDSGGLIRGNCNARSPMTGSTPSWPPR
jgi:pyruvate ferredoxin oxidoreductase alpha subunit